MCLEGSDIIFNDFNLWFADLFEDFKGLIEIIQGFILFASFATKVTILSSGQFVQFFLDFKYRRSSCEIAISKPTTAAILNIKPIVYSILFKFFFGQVAWTKPVVA